MNSGRLPHLSRLATEGYYSSLLSTLPAHSAASWTTATTGVDPGVHGIYDFVDVHDTARLTSSTHRKVKTIFDIVGQFGKIIAVNIPMTFPPWEINGAMVSSPFGSNSPYVFPRRFREAVCRHWKSVPPIGGYHGMLRHPELGFKSTMDGAKAVRDTALSLMEDIDDWLLSFVVFNIPDFFQHYLLRDKSPPERIACVYQTLDSYFFDLWSKFRDSETAFMVISDHGGRSFTKYFSGNAWLTQRGIRQVPRLNRMKAELYVWYRKNWILGRGVSIIPRSLFDKMVQNLSIPSRKQPAECTHLGFILVDKTRIHKTEIARMLAEMRKISFRGRKVVREIYDLSLLYTPDQDNPDYLVELEAGFEHGVDDCFSVISSGPFNIVADHCREGVILLSDRVTRSPPTRTPEMIDVAPTILQITTSCKVDYMRGECLVESQGSRLLEVERRRSDIGSEPYSSSEEQAIHDRLRSLGYE